MAFEFNGTNQYLNTTSTPVQDEPFTMFIRVNTPSGTTDIYPYSLGTTANTTDRFFLRHDGNVQSGYNVLAYKTSNYAIISNVTRPVDSWFSMAGGFESNTSRKVWYFNTSLLTATNATNVADSAQSMGIGIGALYRASPAGYSAMKAADAALWNAFLTDDEITSLSKGFKPYRIRPQSLVFYAPLIRNLQDTKGGLALTNNNTATVTDHPRVY